VAAIGLFTPLRSNKVSVSVGVVVPLEESAGSKSGIEQLIELSARDMEQVNRLILSKVGSDVEMIPEIANHLISSGGKRLRPMLTLAAARMCGYDGDGHVHLAASVEFMHTATLLHDDVVDESDMRRGKLAPRMLWGNQASVLVGDFLLGQAFKMMVEVGSLEALRILSNAAAVIAEGEVMQISAAKNTETTEDEYLAVIRAKTAALFSAAAEVGPVLAGRPRAEQAAFRSFGTNLGLAFQLIDDALDYGGSSEALGKQVGDDFREGKITLPVVLAYRRGTEEDRRFWKRCLEEGDITDADLATAISLIQAHHGIKDTVERARHYGGVAKDALAVFPQTPQKFALLDVIRFCVSRIH
jgi:octaprenyl-diphosphate synthase